MPSIRSTCMENTCVTLDSFVPVYPFRGSLELCTYISELTVSLKCRHFVFRRHLPSPTSMFANPDLF